MSATTAALSQKDDADGSTPQAADAGSLSARTQITEKLLNEKVMVLLRARASCTDARSVFLEQTSQAGLSYNWFIGHFDPGRGDRYTCKLALRQIHESLRDDYELLGSS